MLIFESVDFLPSKGEFEMKQLIENQIKAKISFEELNNALEILTSI